MRALCYTAALLSALLGGCPASHGLDPVDGGSVEAGAADAATADAGSCDPHVFVGCGLATHQWFWDGTDCSPLFECADSGFPSYPACIERHRECAADLDPCTPMDADGVEGPGCPPPGPRFRWTGERCALVCIRDCRGEACDALFDSMESCEAAYASCLP